MSSRNHLLLSIALLLIASVPLYSQGRNSFDIKPTGSFALSAGSYVDSGEGLTSGVYINDIRLGIIGNLGGGWNSELVMGLKGAKVSFKEIFLRYTFPQGHSSIQLGHFSEPFGLEFIESPPFNRFSSFSFPTQAFSAKRKVGVQYTYVNDFLWGGAGIFGDGNIPKGVTSGPQGYAFTARTVYNPLRGNGTIVHIGAAATFRRADGNGSSERTITFSSNEENPFDGTEFASVTIPYARSQRKAVLEGILSFGRFSLMGEGYLVKVARTCNLTPYRAEGAYLQAGLLLGGDHTYGYDPTKARLGMCRVGTWEIMLRVSHLDLNDMSASLYGGKMKGVSINANWYATPFIRVRLSAGRTSTDAYCKVGEGYYNTISAQIMVMLN